MIRRLKSMTNNIITAVGIDVSKGKSMIAIRHPGGEVLRIHRTEQPKQQKLKTAATHSLFRVVQEVTGGEVSQPFHSCKRAEFS